jgi:uncharacterized membrane protein HdeD (DUF308 family)
MGLRGLAAMLFGLLVLILPRSALASLVLTFAAYVAADGVLAIFAGLRAARAGERWWTLIAEGAANLLVAGAVLVWPAIAVVPFIHMASAWAIVTGALMLAASRRLTPPDGRSLLALAGISSIVWGTVATVVGPTVDGGVRSAELWLVAYALLFAIVLLGLTGRLRRRYRADHPVAEPAQAS